jgi:hypothetical protein
MSRVRSAQRVRSPAGTLYFAADRVTLMHAGKCAYTASKHRPEEWHGSDPDEWGLDAAASNGGLGIEEWECPHPPMENTEGDERYYIFHTDPENVPEERDEAAALRDALKVTSSSP